MGIARSSRSCAKTYGRYGGLARRFVLGAFLGHVKIDVAAGLYRQAARDHILIYVA